MNNEVRWRQRFYNFQRAYGKLSELTYLESRSEWEDMALIQAFEFTFELAWKLLKDYLEDGGYAQFTSPKQVLRQALQADIIQDGTIWMNSLQKRNETTHIYDEQILANTVQFIAVDFAPVIEKLSLYFLAESSRE